MKQSELLRKQADMMDMAEKYEIGCWMRLVQYRTPGNCDWVEKADLQFAEKNTYRFALGVVEGKPVFEGDSGWSAYEKQEVTVSGVMNIGPDNPGFTYKGKRGSYSRGDFSWIPPKPKTVTVELPFRTAEYYAKYHANLLGEACRKSLEEQK